MMQSEDAKIAESCNSSQMAGGVTAMPSFWGGEVGREGLFHTRCSFYRFRMLCLICFWSEWVGGRAGKVHTERYLNGDKPKLLFFIFQQTLPS